MKHDKIRNCETCRHRVKPREETKKTKAYCSDCNRMAINGLNKYEAKGARLE